MKQIDLYKQIDNFFSKRIQSAEKKTAQTLINANFDARDYFFAKAPIEWISWLHKKGFFKVLNVEAEDKTQYSFRIPELGYIMHVAESNGDEGKVVEIIESVECNKNFDPEVVDRFLWIASKLTTKQIVKVVQKVKKENWVKLMRNFSMSDYSYESIIKKLVEAKEYKSLLILAEELLVPNTEKEDLDPFEGYFYFKSLNQVGIFEALIDLEDEYIKEGIEIISNTLNYWPKKKNEESEFMFDTDFNLYDVDLFNISINTKRRSHHLDELKSFLAVFIELIKKGIGKSCDSDAREIYNLYIKNLPDSQDMWKIKIFAMSLCSKVFKEDLKIELNRFHKTPHYNDFVTGSEYLHVIEKVFPDWDGPEQRKYVKEVIKYFKQKNEDHPDQGWHKRYGFKILSSIESELIEDERKDCKKYFGETPKKDFKPQPYIREIRSGAVHNQSPIDIAKYENISDLIKDLKDELSPETLKEKYKDDDFLSPRNAEGVGYAIKEDMKKRMDKYLAKAKDFCDVEINVHYTYSFLHAIEEYLRDKQKLSKEDWDNLFELFNTLKEADSSKFQNDNNDDFRDGWLARWSWMEKTAANIIKYFLTKDYLGLFEDKRENALELIEHLLKSEDPILENEIKDNGDLFHIAINSTRGVAFQALVNFIYLDGEEKLEDDVVFLYKKTIKQASLSVRFVIGHYLASFYYRDNKVVATLFSDIFPRGEANYEKFFAAWEGYLAASIYKELFEELQEYYDYALTINPSKYPERHEKRDLNKGIANHLALAFAHFDEVQYKEDDKHLLLEKLWKGKDVKKQKQFVSFLGNGVISFRNVDENRINKEKLENFWTLLLSRKDLDEDVYSAFSYWINSEKDVFEYDWLAEKMAKTLEKSNGKIDWDYGIVKKLPELAKANPDKTLIILKKYLFEEAIGDSRIKKWFYLEGDKIEVFGELYKLRKSETTKLINELLEKGGRPFWPLKDIVEE